MGIGGCSMPGEKRPNPIIVYIAKGDYGPKQVSKGFGAEN